MNSRIENIIANGHMKELLLGESEYFFPDPTYRSEQDLDLIINTIIHLISQNNNELLTEFQNVTIEISQTNILLGLDITFTLILYLDKKLYEIFHLTDLCKRLREIISKKENTLGEAENTLIKAINKKFPSAEL